MCEGDSRRGLELTLPALFWSVIAQGLEGEGFSALLYQFTASCSLLRRPPLRAQAFRQWLEVLHGKDARTPSVIGIQALFSLLGLRNSGGKKHLGRRIVSSLHFLHKPSLNDLLFASVGVSKLKILKNTAHNITLPTIIVRTPEDPSLSLQCRESPQTKCRRQRRTAFHLALRRQAARSQTAAPSSKLSRSPFR